MFHYRPVPSAAAAVLLTLEVHCGSGPPDLRLAFVHGQSFRVSISVGWRAGSIILQRHRGLGTGPAGGEKPGAGAPYLVWNPV